MSNTHVQEPAPRARSRNRWLRWIIVGVLGAVALAVGVYVYVEYARDQDLRDAVAEASGRTGSTTAASWTASN